MAKFGRELKLDMSEYIKNGKLNDERDCNVPKPIDYGLSQQKLKEWGQILRIQEEETVLDSI